VAGQLTRDAPLTKRAKLRGSLVTTGYDGRRCSGRTMVPYRAEPDLNIYNLQPLLRQDETNA
jgi:hypothetical protein